MVLYGAKRRASQTPLEDQSLNLYVVLATFFNEVILNVYYPLVFFAIFSQAASLQTCIT